MSYKKSPKIMSLLSELSGFEHNYGCHFSMRLGRFLITKVYDLTITNTPHYYIKVENICVFCEGFFCFDGAEKLEPFIVKALTEKIDETKNKRKIQREEQERKQRELVDSFLHDNLSY